MNVISRVRAGATVLRANLNLPERPDRYARALWALHRHGATALGSVAFAVERTPDRTALVDDQGRISYREMWDETHAMAAAMGAAGIESGTRVGLLAENARFFVQALLATGLTGADLVLLNTNSAGPQLKDVVRHEEIHFVVASDACAGLAREGGASTLLVEECLLMRAQEHAGERVGPPSRPGRTTLLTSGTTGTPRGAARAPGGELEAAAALLGRIPLRHGGTRLVSPPLFHGWGLTHLLLGLGMSATVVLQGRFDAKAVVRAVEEHRVDVLVVVPVMLQRILELDPEHLAATDLSHLRILACSGSALPPSVAEEALHRFGLVLYNVYGSTEVAVASIATPTELRTDPATAGRPAPGVTVRLFDHNDRPVAAGRSGRVFVAGAMQFEGYTSGGGKDVLHGLMSTGDLGRFDRHGRLHVVGREDDMIVSGAENVFPREIEDLLITHPEINDVAVVGVSDPEFGEVLKACVVPVPGSSLDPDAVKGFVRDRLARHKVPRHVVLVPELPRNATGKVLRRKLVSS